MEAEYKILFVGGVFLDKQKEYINKNSKGAIQYAANSLQWNYIHGIENNLLNKIDLLNAVFVGTFPKYFNKIFVKGCGEYIDDDRYITDVGFVNLPVIAENIKYFALKRSINKKKEIYVIAYGFFEQNIKLLSYVKKYSNITTCLIIPDLPQYMSLNRDLSVLRKILLYRIQNIFDRYRNHIDCFSVITKQMGESLNIPTDKYVVIDGMIEFTGLSIQNIIQNNNENTQFSFLYTGGLSSSYGTDMLVNCFLKMKNKDTELWICGDGPYLKALLNICKTESRIHYMGVLPQDECIKMQHLASCLVNPRQDSEITKYSFPSKTMEYLASGKPVIAKKLDGMDDRYADLFYHFNDSDDLIEVMDMVSGLDADILNNTGLKGKKFVAINKNSKYQTKKLLNLLTINIGEGNK